MERNRGVRPIAIAGAVLLVAVACQGGGASPLPGATDVPATAGPTSPAPPTSPPTAAPTAGVLLPGRLLFSRFNESNHTNQGSFISLADGSQEIEVPLPWTEGLFRWSRSGTEIVVGTQLADGRVGTAIVDAEGNVLRVLEIPDPTLQLPCGAWTIDDVRLACEGWDDSDPSRRGIFSIRASDGGDLQRLTTTPEGMSDIPGDYSPSGQFLFKRGAGDEGPGPLLLLDPEGAEPRQVGTSSYEDAGRFSPDGTLVLTAVGGSIMIIDLNGQVVNSFADDAFSFGAAWSPDGTHIAFSRTTGGYRSDIWTSLPDGTDRQQVTRTPANEINVDWGVGAD